jgi:hypothetical protein
MAEIIGTTVQVKVESFQVPMTVTDAKVAYGNRRLLVSPIGGRGQAWVDASRIEPQRSQKSTPQDERGSHPEETTEAALARMWAKSRGIHVNTRGRIPAPILKEYRETVAGKQPTAA